jgi:hypothetical protein
LAGAGATSANARSAQPPAARPRGRIGARLARVRGRDRPVGRPDTPARVLAQLMRPRRQSTHRESSRLRRRASASAIDACCLTQPGCVGDLRYASFRDAARRFTTRRGRPAGPRRPRPPLPRPRRAIFRDDFSGAGGAEDPAPARAVRGSAPTAGRRRRAMGQDQSATAIRVRTRKAPNNRRLRAIGRCVDLEANRATTALSLIRLAPKAL